MSAQSYTKLAIFFHWLTALMIFVAFPLGLYMHDLPFSPNKLQLYSYHKWLGITVLLIAILRLTWRATHPAPPMLAMPRWQQLLAHSIHHLLYLLIFAIPISGWLMSSAKGFQTVYFGILPLPDLLAKNKELGDLLAEVHELLNYTLLALVGAHIAGALKHHFVERDDTLKRMSFCYKGKKTDA
ncbi:MAG: cytochrome b [Pseudomonadota bacterium]